MVNWPGIEMGWKVVVLEENVPRYRSSMVELPKKYCITYKPLKWTNKAKGSMGIFYFADADKDAALWYWKTIDMWLHGGRNIGTATLWQCIAYNYAPAATREDMFRAVYLGKLKARQFAGLGRYYSCRLAERIMLLWEEKVPTVYIKPAYAGGRKG